jgi:glycosyltransferase involved in cell wall biosynthesis
LAYDITFYCPDRHILYDGHTPDQVGVGGGITARVRMARALARRGHRVTAVVNCPRREAIDGVEYLPLKEARRPFGDVILLTTSGDGLDLTPALDLRLEARLRVVWIHGEDKPRGLDRLDPDYIYCVSNFIADRVRQRWRTPGDRVFVTYNGFDEPMFREAASHAEARDPFRLVYFSHPSKGLETSLEVLRRLRRLEPRFHLVVLGSEGLWGGRPRPRAEEPGVTFLGLVGQRQVARELLKSTFSIQLQDREEPGALSIPEALRAGCVVLASPVGCYSEMIADGRSGFLITEDHTTEAGREAAVDLLLELARSPETVASIRWQAQGIPWSIDRMAEVWEGHWELGLGGGHRGWHPTADLPKCGRCGGVTLTLADGLHCRECGEYRRETTLAQSSALEGAHA